MQWLQRHDRISLQKPQSSASTGFIGCKVVSQFGGRRLRRGGLSHRLRHSRSSSSFLFASQPGSRPVLSKAVPAVTSRWHLARGTCCCHCHCACPHLHKEVPGVLHLLKVAFPGYTQQPAHKGKNLGRFNRHTLAPVYKAPVRSAVTHPNKTVPLRLGATSAASISKICVASNHLALAARHWQAPSEVECSQGRCGCWLLPLAQGMRQPQGPSQPGQGFANSSAG